MRLRDETKLAAGLLSMVLAISFSRLGEFRLYGGFCLFVSGRPVYRLIDSDEFSLFSEQKTEAQNPNQPLK
jgi:hypothetical protein